MDAINKLDVGLGDEHSSGQLLRKLLPQAHKAARLFLLENDVMEITFMAFMASKYIRINNIHKLTIRHDAEGWHANLLLRRVPFGMPTIYGVTGAVPQVSRQKAEEDAVRLLAEVLLIERGCQLTQPYEPLLKESRFFKLCGRHVFITLENIERAGAEAAKKGIAVDPRSLAPMVIRDFPHGFANKDWLGVVPTSWPAYTEIMSALLAVGICSFDLEETKGLYSDSQLYFLLRGLSPAPTITRAMTEIKVPKQTFTSMRCRAST